MKTGGEIKMLKPKFEIGDKVFDYYLPKHWDKFVTTFTVKGIYYQLPYTLAGADSIDREYKGRFYYILVDYDNHEFTQSELGLGKRRK
jgi:hypothetical protein